MDNMFSMHIVFISGYTVTVRADNLIELQSIMRGLEIAHREVPCLDSIAFSGEKVYNFERRTDKEG